MIVYHVTKTRESFEAICHSMKLIPKLNTVTRRDDLVYLNLVPFVPGNWALDVIGEDTNQAWIMELIISDNTPFMDDPTGEGELYGGKWIAIVGEVSVETITHVHYVPDVRLWERGK